MSAMPAIGANPVGFHNGAAATEISKSYVDNDGHPPEPVYTETEEERQAGIAKLARQLSRSSTTYDREGDLGHAFLHPAPGSNLDPDSPSFSYRAWAKALLNVRDLDANPLRSSGLAFRSLSVHGFGTATDYQKTFFNAPLEALTIAKGLFGVRRDQKIQILRDFDGVLHSGELLVVLGPPGSGCSTLLKTIAGETEGIYISKESHLNYKGIPPKQMHSQFKGEAIYTAEIDVHFPQLSVGDTLYVAAMARSPRQPPAGLTQQQWAIHRRDAIMGCFGIAHTKNTRVGNEYVRGVSGGERKRVTIAEAALSEAPLACWDNSTRGLDSANAIEFCRSLKMQADLLGTTACVAIYQSPQSAYELFDKVTVLYEGRQIYFGPIRDAKAFFVEMGFYCPEQQTDPDFLTSLTSPQERRIRPGFENRTPRTPDEFVERWKASDAYRALLQEIETYEQRHPVGGDELQRFKESRRAQQAKRQSVKSPYTLSYAGQIRLCLWRGWQRLKGDPSLTYAQLFGNMCMGLIIASLFYNLQEDTASFYARSALLFFAILLSAFASALEILILYAQRPIVEKHDRYAFYHPSAEAFASMLCDMPYKITNAIAFNLILYFMTNLRRTPGAFFFFLFVSFLLTLIMSSLFRTMASASRTLAQALTPAAILILALVMYTGFALNVNNMLGWASWIRWLVPISYGFEALMLNEFVGREYTCSAYIPTGAGYDSVANQICSAQGAVAGQTSVSGATFVNVAYNYVNGHKWRNVGILFGFLIFQTVVYIIAAELVRAKRSRGEVLVFQRTHLKQARRVLAADADPEKAASGRHEKSLAHSSSSESTDIGLVKQTAIFHWSDVCYDIKIKGENRRILDHVDGWIKPGTMTALMGVSGAGKTSLLDALATRTTMGVISGEMLVDGKPRDQSFQRKTGYCMQQDLHLPTATVRESLEFSALMRQPGHIPKAEKLAYVKEVIKMLDMEDYADAVVGVLGEGLNVEQRKRLTIGVELAAKPQLLIFLDEPTSGLDSQTSWAICDLMEKLAKNDQAVLCTLHQPSAMLFSRFDRLLLLARGGKTIYFGPIGKQSVHLVDYFTDNGAPAMREGDNPAEYMLHVIGAAPGSETNIDWHETWRKSPQYAEVKRTLEDFKTELPAKAEKISILTVQQKGEYAEFAAPFLDQFRAVFKRVFQQFLRTPSYLYAKYCLLGGVGLFIGFSFFQAGNSMTELQNQMFAMFMLLTVFAQLTQQIGPNFVEQRALYEVRERPAKTYSWQAWLLANILIEIPFQIAGAVLLFFTFYYTVGYQRNAIPDGQVAERGGLFFLYMLVFMIFASTFSHLLISGMETAENAGNLGNLFFSLSLVFNGVLVPPSQLGWWIWMNRVSPFTYLTGGFLSVGLANNVVVCAENELLHFPPPSGQTCGQYMQSYISSVGAGYLTDPSNTTDCSFCTINETNQFLSSIAVNYSERWRNWGILWVYVVFNIVAAVAFYYFARVPKKSKRKQKAD